MIKFTRHTLDNGLTMICNTDTSTPFVSVNILYKVGARDEGIVGRMPSSKLAEEHVMQQAVHRLPHLLFHHHLQQDEIDATVFVLAPHAEARVLDLLDNGVFKRVVQIHVTGDLCRKARLFPGRYQIGKKREVVAHIGPGVETDRMREWLPV